MNADPITIETVREIALKLPGVEDGLSYGAPALKRNGNMFVRWREDLDAIVVKSTFDQRAELMSELPDVYFITDHYLNYPWVLVSLSAVTLDALSGIIRSAYDLAGLEKSRSTKKTN